MTKIKMIGAAIILSSVIAAPAMAQPVTSQYGYGQSAYCATREPGNPFSEQDDYQAWSAWRSRGSWDSRGDNACARDPQIHRRQAGF
jgi:hypothetical protein